jgi:hypothetical protein
VPLPPELAHPQQQLLDDWRRELAAGATRVGWKIGHGIPEVQTIVGDQPVIGYLTSRTLLVDGSAWSRQGEDLRAETELGVVLANELHAGAGPAEAAGAIGGLCVALEIVDLPRQPGDLDAVMPATCSTERSCSGGPVRSGGIGWVARACVWIKLSTVRASRCRTRSGSCRRSRKYWASSVGRFCRGIVSCRAHSHTSRLATPAPRAPRSKTSGFAVDPGPGVSEGHDTLWRVLELTLAAD